MQNSTRPNSNLIVQNEQLILRNERLLDELSHSKIGDENLNDTLYQPLTGFPISKIEQFDYLNNEDQRNLRKKLVRKSFQSFSNHKLFVDGVFFKISLHFKLNFNILLDELCT